MADVTAFGDIRTFTPEEQRRLEAERQREILRQQLVSRYNLGNMILEPGGEYGPQMRVSEPTSGRGTGLSGPIGALLSGVPGMAQIATPADSADMKRKRLRLLELERERALAQAAPPAEEAKPEPEGPGKLESFARGVGQGATMGFGDEAGGAVAAGLQALTNMLPQSVRDSLDLVEAPAGEAYTYTRDADRAANDAAERAHGGYYLGGNVAGGLLTAPLMPGVGGAKAIGPTLKSGAFQTLGSLARAGGSLGLKTGAAYGLGSSRADLLSGDAGQYLQAAKDTTLGSLLGGALGYGMPIVGAGLGYVGRNFVSPALQFIRGGYVNPTPEAQRLGRAGVNLTLGQMDPRSAYGRTEELGAKSVTGSALSRARERAASETRDVILKGAGAPGATPPTSGAPVAQQLDELAAGFGRLYDEALGGARVRPGNDLHNAFENAARAADLDAAPSVREQASKWLANQAQTLRPDKQTGEVDARAVQALRTQLRDQIRKLGDEGKDRQLAEIYGRAEQAVSDMLGDQLPAANAAKLNAADASYRNLLAARAAAKSAYRAQDEFTPAQMLQAIESKGATQGLKATARDAQAVLSASYPPTGVMAWASNIPGAKQFAPTLLGLNNSVPFLRQHALRQMIAPGLPARALAATGQAIEGASRSPRASSQAARTLLDLFNPPPTPPAASFVSADDELQPWAMAPETP